LPLSKKKKSSKREEKTYENCGNYKKIVIELLTDLERKRILIS
jgi:hypothetical protein